MYLYLQRSDSSPVPRSRTNSWQWSFSSAVWQQVVGLLLLFEFVVVFVFVFWGQLWQQVLGLLRSHTYLMMILIAAGVDYNHKQSQWWFWWQLLVASVGIMIILNCRSRLYSTPSHNRLYSGYSDSRSLWYKNKTRWSNWELHLIVAFNSIATAQIISLFRAMSPRSTYK